MSRVTDAAEWNALFSKVEHPHMVQSWAYGEAKQAASGWRTRRSGFDAGGWRTRRLVFKRGDEPVAICQLLDKSLAGVRCASRLNRGPLFLGADPGRDVVRDVFGALRSHWRHLRGALVLAPALAVGPENYGLLAELGFRPRHQAGWCSDRVDLRVDEEQLRKNLASNWRNHLKQAERSGLEITISNSPEDVEWIIGRHVENMTEKDFSGPAPAFLRTLYRSAPDDFLIFQARLAEEAVGGMVAYRFGQAAEYYVGWMGSEGRKVNVGRFLYWQGALELRRRGCRWFDLGGKRAGATEPFKRGMGGVEYRLLNEWLAF
jgi:hypothetical protein